MELQSDSGKYKSVASVGSNVSEARDIPTSFLNLTLGKNPFKNVLSKPKFTSASCANVAPHVRVLCPFAGMLSALSIPSLPSMILPHHFKAVDKNNAPLDFEEVIFRIERALRERVELSYEINPMDCTWNVVYLYGSSYYKCQIHVYKDVDETLLVEVQKITGCCMAFRSFFKEIKASITGCPFRSPPVNITLPKVESLSENEVHNSLRPIVNMAMDCCMDAQLGAAKIICDLSQREDMHQALIESGSVEALVNVISTGNDFSRQHAILALANLSCSQCCQEKIIDAGVLPALLMFITNGPYHTAVMGRESARILANLSDRLAARVIAAVGEKSLKCWMESVDSLNDAFVKQQAVRARGSLLFAIDSPLKFDDMAQPVLTR